MTLAKETLDTLVDREGISEASVDFPGLPTASLPWHVSDKRLHNQVTGPPQLLRTHPNHPSRAGLPHLSVLVQCWEQSRACGVRVRDGA